MEREVGRNVELVWLTGRLAPDFQTIANFRKNNGEAFAATDASINRYIGQLENMAKQVKEIIGSVDLSAVADRSHYRSEEFLDCDERDITAYVPKSSTSDNRAKGKFAREDFCYIRKDSEYKCPAGRDWFDMRLHSKTTRPSPDLGPRCVSAGGIPMGT